MTTLIPFFFSMICMLLSAPIVIYISRKFQLLDRPNERKVHIHYISRLGGICFFFSIWFTLFLMHQFEKFSWDRDFWPVLMWGSLIAFSIGLWDDLKNLSAKQKLLFQVVLGIVAVELGFKITEIQFDFWSPIEFGRLSGVVSVFWIVMVMNAVNMIDGLDGLAAGFALPVFAVLATLGYLNMNLGLMMISMVCAAACLAFLFFNFHPAKMFMGDSGSMTLGFILAILTPTGGKGDTSTNVFMPIFLLAFPLIDLTTAVLRRMIHAKSHEKDIGILGLIKRTFNADGNHIHHRLLKLGFSQRKIVSIIYAFTIISCGLALVSVYFSFGLIFFLFIFYVWFTVQCIRLLDYEEFVTGSYRSLRKDFEEKKKLSTAPSLIKKVQ